MRLWVERLRWALVAAALLLIAVLASLLGYSRYRAVKAWRQILAHSGATITHEAHEITWSQAVGGRTVFTIHAADAVPHGDGKYTLRNVVLVLYGAKGARVDRISGAEFEYDQKNEVARALGEVHMDLQAPAALSPGSHEEHASKPESSPAVNGVAEAPQTIHVRTSGLVYTRKMGTASTDQEVEIAYEGFQGYSRGAEFNSAQSVVHLLADVRANGPVRGKPTQLTATRADLERDTDVIRLTQPRIRSGSGPDVREATASQATLHLRKDGSLQLIEAREVGVHEGSRSLRAASLNATMNGSSGLQAAELTGGVQLDDTDPRRPAHVGARVLTVACDSNAIIQTIMAQGGVTGSAEDRSGSKPLRRQISGDRITATMRPATGNARELADIKATGAALVRAESVVPGRPPHSTEQIKTTEVAGDQLKLTFAQGERAKSEPQVLTATGNTRISQSTPDGAAQSGTGDSLVVHFEGVGAGKFSRKSKAAEVQVASAEQMGHVRLSSIPAPGSKGNSEPGEAMADRAEFDDSAEQVILTGHPVVRQGTTSISAVSIILSQQTGDAAAHGDVTGSFAQASAAAQGPVTHVAAQDAFLDRALKTADFRGTDARPARMWQGASQLAAADLLLDDTHKTIAARPRGAGGLVHAVFSGTSTSPARTPPQAGSKDKRAQIDAKNDVIAITSARFDYSEETQEAIFLGNVRAETASGHAQANRAVAFLNPDKSAAKNDNSSANPLAGTVQKIVLSGNVRVAEPGRTGTGDQLLYTASNQQFVLTGSPGNLPRIADEKQGNITGATLLFGAADSTIVVAGEPGAHGQARGRVHTETVVKP